ncbi:MAG: hypothetical protein JXN60_08180, partial [Lentisphaerae bacterium]|nr:hypothetical protein [Lentisphaerota bacterium]
LFMTVGAHIAVLLPHNLAVKLSETIGENGHESLSRLSGERYGWRQLGQQVDAVLKEMKQAPENNGRDVFVICSQYGVASNLAFYTPGQIQTHLWSKRRVHGENYRFWDDFPSLKGMNAIFVVKQERHIENALSSLQKHFARLDAPLHVPITINGQQIRSFLIMRCYEFNGITPVFDNNPAQRKQI